MEFRELENRYTLPNDCDHDASMQVLIDVDGVLITLSRISVSAWAQIVRQELDRQVGIPESYVVYLGKMGAAVMMVHPRPKQDYHVMGYYTPLRKAL